MHKIGIVGAGIAGLHLALYLQKRGLEPVIITDREPESYRDARLLNTVAHHATTLERESVLGVNHWTDPADHYFYHDHWFNLPEPGPLHFPGYFEKPSRAVDYRIYLPRLMQDFAERGGAIEYRRIENKDIAPLIDRFDLLVVSIGKGPLAELFEHDAVETPFAEPQRRLCVGLYTGIAKTAPMNVTLSVTPGVGELIVIPVVTFGGIAHTLLMENLPGGPMEYLASERYDDDPKTFLRNVLDAVEEFHPGVYERIEPSSLDLCQPQDLLQGGVRPVVRETAVELDGGKFAVSVGDVHCTVDPVNGQGANIASYSAFILGEEIANASAFDRRFVERVDDRRNRRVLGASRWTNLMMGPPSAELQMLIGAMSQNRALCDEFTQNFNAPEKQWERLGSPESIRHWVESAMQSTTQ
jgi:2-polyprenyl-6-methoxyphenol hydroxylase-like FAD-dependent oxidoreductase